MKARRRVRRIVPQIVFGTVFAGVVPMAASSCDSGSSTSSSSSSGQLGVGCSFAECGVAAPCFGDQCGVPPPSDGAADGDGEGGDGDAMGVADVSFG